MSSNFYYLKELEDQAFDTEKSGMVLEGGHL